MCNGQSFPSSLGESEKSDTKVIIVKQILPTARIFFIFDGEFPLKYQHEI
jgi:hypothetical protein